MNSNYRSVCVAPENLSPGSGNEGKEKIVLNRRPETSTEENIDAFNQRSTCCKRCSYAGETQCFPVEPSGCSKRCLHMMEKLSNSPLVSHGKYRCGQRTVRLAVAARSQNQNQAASCAQAQRMVLDESRSFFRVHTGYFSKYSEVYKSRVHRQPVGHVLSPVLYRAPSVRINLIVCLIELCTSFELRDKFGGGAGTITSNVDNSDNLRRSLRLRGLSPNSTVKRK
ncbi:hypothetical protein TNCV_761991 [Trichonephila clavipes]|nr:hypothetical protein TNCV_761991 [Trichonephila clavipes]